MPMKQHPSNTPAPCTRRWCSSGPPDLFPASHGNVAVYYEAASVIISLTLLGQIWELRARQRTGDAVRALLRLAPRTAGR